MVNSKLEALVRKLYEELEVRAFIHPSPQAAKVDWERCMKYVGGTNCGVSRMKDETDRGVLVVFVGRSQELEQGLYRMQPNGSRISLPDSAIHAVKARRVQTVIKAAKSDRLGGFRQVTRLGEQGAAIDEAGEINLPRNQG